MAVTAAAAAAGQPTTRYLFTQRCHSQPESQVEHDPFSSGDLVIYTKRKRSKTLVCIRGINKSQLSLLRSGIKLMGYSSTF